MNANDIVTTLHFAHAWGVERHVAQRRAARLGEKLGLRSVKARSPSGQLILAYSKTDAERIMEAWREREGRLDANAARENRRAKDIEFQIGTSNRPDVITVYDLAKSLNISRSRASQIARRGEGKLGIARVKARAASGQKIIAYMRSDGERLIKLYKEKRAVMASRRKAKEKRKRQKEAIPQPPAPSSRNEAFYLIELWPGVADICKIGWTSDIEQRLRSYRTTSPHLRLVKSWPCARARDTEATRYALTFQGLESIESETFRTHKVEAVVLHLDQFFRTTTEKDT